MAPRSWIVNEEKGWKKMDEVTRITEAGKDVVTWFKENSVKWKYRGNLLDVSMDEAVMPVNDKLQVIKKKKNGHDHHGIGGMDRRDRSQQESR